MKNKKNGGKNLSREAKWAEAKRRCRLNVETLRMAKDMGLNPRSLIRNIPSKSEPWKAPVHVWIRDFYDKRRRKAEARAARRARQAPPPAPGAPEGPDPPAPALPRDPPPAGRPSRPEPSPTKPEQAEIDECWAEKSLFSDEEPGREDIEETNRDMLLRQEEFLRAARFIARAFSRIPEVTQVVLFGSVAGPLEKEVPRFREYRRRGIAVYHECKDADLAVRMTRIDRLRSLYKARGRALFDLHRELGIGVTHEQVEVFVLDAATGRYLGRLCRFGRCPKPGKAVCLAPGCGDPPFLKRDNFQLRSDALDPGRSLVLFDRAKKQPPGSSPARSGDVPF
jgi:hypothetical protein